MIFNSTISILIDIVFPSYIVSPVCTTWRALSTPYQRASTLRWKCKRYCINNSITRFMTRTKFHVIIYTLIFQIVWSEQLKQLQADHADELGTAARAIDQSIERAESNVEWMSLHYQEVLDWIQQNP